MSELSNLPNHPNLEPREVAAFLRVSLAWVYDQIHQKHLPALKVGPHYRIPRQKFVDWYEYQQQQLEESV